MKIILDELKVFVVVVDGGLIMVVVEVLELIILVISCILVWLEDKL